MSNSPTNKAVLMEFLSEVEGVLEGHWKPPVNTMNHVNACMKCFRLSLSDTDTLFTLLVEAVCDWRDTYCV